MRPAILFSSFASSCCQGFSHFSIDFAELPVQKLQAISPSSFFSLTPASSASVLLELGPDTGGVLWGFLPLFGPQLFLSFPFGSQFQ